MARRHVIVGGGTAGWNAILAIREVDHGESAIVLVSSERPYSRMVLPYYLSRGIAESHVFTAPPARLAQLKVQTKIGRRATTLDTATNTLTLDDGTSVPYDDLLIATGSSPVRAAVPGADGSAVHSFWTLPQAQEVLAQIREGSHVVMVGAGFIAFTILNAILSHRARLTILEIAPRILPRMVDAPGAQLVETWLRRHGVEVRPGVRLTAIEDAQGKKRLRLDKGEDLLGDLVIMATGIRPNLEWLQGSGVRVSRGILVDEHLRSNVPNVYAAGDVAEGRDLVTGESTLHAIEPTAMDHGRIAGSNMAGKNLAYRGSLLMNIVEVCHLDIASFGAWDNPTAEVMTAERPGQFAYRKLLWRGDRLVGAIILGRSNDIWTTNDIGMLKGLTQAGGGLGAWKERLRRNPFDIKPAYIASGTTGRLLPQTLLGRSSVPAGQVVG